MGRYNALSFRITTVGNDGDFKNLSSFLERAKEAVNMGTLDKYGKMGVDALSAATPKDTGLTASSWSYEITRGNGIIELSFNNSNVNKGIPIAILIQYGHGLPNGGFVQGIDYINPALKPIFQQLADEIWKEVTK